MPASRSLFSLSALTSLALIACEPGSGPDSSGARSSPLYRCIGEPPYDQAGVDSLLADLKIHPFVCKDGQMVQVGKPSAKSAVGVDSVRIHAYVMDSRCRFITEHQTVLPADRPLFTSAVWDSKDAQGKPVPTGEYYVNAVADRGAAGKDTSYHKMALIQNPCAP